MSEFGLIIIWQQHLDHVGDVKSYLEERFNTIQHYDIKWSEKNLYQNFYRFYGDRLSTKSIKEKAKQASSFRLIIFRDDSPKYAFRATARGVEEVNTNFFDMKKYFRKSFNTRFGIHGSNDEIETSRDLSLLLGINLKDYKKNHNNSWDGKIITIDRDISGCEGWDSLKQFFYCINSVAPYLILRNYEDLNKDINQIEDIDFLVTNRDKFALFANAKKMSKGTERANYQITVTGKALNIDLRYIGDNYFDQFWQKDCLDKRFLHQDGFYIMDPENQRFSLIYHVLIHKTTVPKKYKLFNQMDINELREELYKFMKEKNYLMVEPKDITLKFNKDNGGYIKFSRPRRLRSRKGFLGLLKRVLYRLNNWIHLRRGPG